MYLVDLQEEFRYCTHVSVTTVAENKNLKKTISIFIALTYDN